MKNIFKKIRDIFLFIVSIRAEIGLILLGVFLFFVATNIQSGWMFFVVAMIFGVLGLSLAQSLSSVSRLRIVRRFPETCAEDDEITVHLTIYNDSKKPKYMILIQDTFPALFPEQKDEKILIDYIAGMNKTEVTYKVRCYHRGVHRFQKVKVESAGLMGFFSFTRNVVAENDRIVVFPMSYRLDNFILDNISPYFARDDKTYMTTGKSHDFLGIREYEPGQEIRFIHWPSTAKLGKFMVKEFKEIATHSLSLIFDANECASVGSGRDTAGEDMFRAAATLLKSAKKKRYSFDLYVRSGESVIADKNLGEKKGMFRFAELNYDTEIKLEDNMPHISRYIGPLDHIYILRVLPFEDIKHLQALLDKKAFVSVVFFHPESYAPEEEKEKYSELTDVYNAQIVELARMGVSAHIYGKGSSLSRLLAFKRRVGTAKV
ncbi:MAG: DUF58 domain-containing protein [Firmicutes bacterium]|nr:DUF58 domain-containing protein [Bacillota bacterium]